MILLFFVFLMPPQPPGSTLFPYTTLFRSRWRPGSADSVVLPVPDSPKKTATRPSSSTLAEQCIGKTPSSGSRSFMTVKRSEEHTSELQSHVNLVCRLLLEKKKQIKKQTPH